MFEKSIDLFESVIQLHGDGLLAATDRRADPGMWTVGAFHAADDKAVHADVWERHPGAYELLYVTKGAVRVHLREGGEPVTVGAGNCYVVPKNTWHRLTVVEPTDLLTISPRAETQHERRTD
ncbi:cupin domain-containing protein [Sciscionella sediminilitoris]|uniref:cupin domain-containing protein n=1 Tax=Sciscionella sediminilitoris TaxID=1445613 RepID=UPI0004DF8E11|nr:cupin domain-containing protein [Sciscionella sp. SE31]